MTTCFVLEVIISIIAVIAFLWTEDIRLPMTLIDRWTPLMILILAICWITDLALARYRKQEEEEK